MCLWRTNNLQHVFFITVTWQKYTWIQITSESSSFKSLRKASFTRFHFLRFWLRHDAFLSKGKLMYRESTKKINIAVSQLAPYAFTNTYCRPLPDWTCNTNTCSYLPFQFCYCSTNFTVNSSQFIKSLKLLCQLEANCIGNMFGSSYSALQNFFISFWLDIKMAATDNFSFRLSNIQKKKSSRIKDHHR